MIVNGFSIDIYHSDVFDIREWEGDLTAHWIQKSCLESWSHALGCWRRKVKWVMGSKLWSCLYIYISLAFHYIPYIELPTKPGAGKALQAIAGDIGEGAGSLSWLARSFSKSLELTLKDPSGVLLMPGSFSSLVFRNGIMINQQKIDFMVACVNKFPRWYIYIFGITNWVLESRTVMINICSVIWLSHGCWIRNPRRRAHGFAFLSPLGCLSK